MTKNTRVRERSVIVPPRMLAVGETFAWVFLSPSGRFGEAEKFDVTISHRCPFCGASAVCPLPPPLLAKEVDGTTHVCHPGLGGCNHGFEVTS